MSFRIFTSVAAHLGGGVRFFEIALCGSMSFVFSKSHRVVWCGSYSIGSRTVRRGAVYTSSKARCRCFFLFDDAMWYEVWFFENRTMPCGEVERAP